MTIFSVAGSPPAVTVRYVPVAAWAFVGLAAYGVGQIITRVLDGRIPAGPGALVAIAALIGFALFILYAGGQLVLASFDRGADRVLVRRYGLTGRSVDERRLSEVVGLDVRVLRRSQHRLELRLRSGERLPLTTYFVVTLSTRGVARLSDALGIQPTLIEVVAESRF